MTVSVTHVTPSGKITGDNWSAEHVVTGTPDKYLGFDGGGNLTELDGASGAAWGGVTGTLADQTDLQAALDAKANAADIGTAFEAGPVTAPTTTDLATWVNQGTSTVSNGTGALILRPQADGLLHGLEKVAPSVPFDVYCRFDAITMSDATTATQLDSTAGVILRDSADGELLLCGVYFQRVSGQNSYSAIIQRWTASGATFSANAVRFYLPIAPQWLRVNVTSTTITLYVSADGKNFIQVPTTETVSAFIDNVDRIGIGATSDSDIDSAAILCSYFSTNAPA